MRKHLPFLEQFAGEIRRDGFSEVYLLGMGGSSLCAEVLRDVAAPRGSGISLTVLDSTDERTVRHVTSTMNASRALFLVASKSGSTLEVTSLERHFWSVMKTVLGAETGRHFLAITDPGTTLVTHASASGYRHTFINPPDIGGRYSALSLFGLVPGALLGVPLSAMLDSAAAMAARCAADRPDNPGLALGAFMGEHALAGRDKLTTLMAATMAPLGAWIEQLVAESTGKDGKGVLPVVDEPLGDTPEYGKDRAFVAVLTPDADRERQLANKLSAADRPVFMIDMDPGQLGAEFFRWEFATAVAGVVLDVNPFDEPNVRGAKTMTLRQLDRRVDGQLQVQPPFAEGTKVSNRDFEPANAPLDNPRRYFAILDYLPPDSGRSAAVAAVRAGLRARTGYASTYGIGPRYLHSTGQYHKGGPNTGMFVLLTAADATATEIPEAGYSFSTLKLAQALGDFDALVATERVVIHSHVNDPNADFSAMLDELVKRVG